MSVFVGDLVRCGGTVGPVVEVDDDIGIVEVRTPDGLLAFPTYLVETIDEKTEFAGILRASASQQPVLFQPSLWKQVALVVAVATAVSVFLIGCVFAATYLAVWLSHIHLIR